jgi:hypothetical protein
MMFAVSILYLLYKLTVDRAEENNTAVLLDEERTVLHSFDRIILEYTYVRWGLYLEISSQFHIAVTNAGLESDARRRAQAI